MFVEALQGFDHDRVAIRKGDRFEVSDVAAGELQRNGLVVPVFNPRVAGGKKSSASPAAQALPQTTAKKSGGGSKRGRKSAPSSQ